MHVYMRCAAAQILQALTALLWQTRECCNVVYTIAIQVYSGGDTQMPRPAGLFLKTSRLLPGHLDQLEEDTADSPCVCPPVLPCVPHEVSYDY